MEFKIKDKPGFTPQIGQLVTMMDYARLTTLHAVKGLTVEQLDYLPTKQSNSIGALLYHMAAVEFGFQIGFFDGRKPTEEEAAEWGPAYSLGDLGRSKIKGHSLDFYLDKLESVRQRTLAEFAKRDDNWLFADALWGDNPSNNYFIWFHVFEDEISHRGQIRILKKKLPN